MGDRSHALIRGNSTMSRWVLLATTVVLVLLGNGRAARLERWDSAIRMPTDHHDDDDQDGSDDLDGDQVAGTRWAVLVAGSSGYGNYRHQVTYIINYM